MSSIADFEEGTAFERWALEALVPLPLTRPHGAKKDIASNRVFVTPEPVVLRVFAGGVREVGIDLRPLAFGAAWKVLDLLMELALWNSGTRPSASGRLAIETKAQLARSGAGVCLPLSADTAIWAVLCATYAETKEIRHSLVHRLAEVDPAMGTLIGRDPQGQPLTPLNAEQQEAFCRATLRATLAALTQRQSPRERSDLAWQLDQLQSHHQRSLLGGKQLRPPPLIIAPTVLTGTAVTLDVPIVLANARANFPEPPQLDVTVLLPDGRWIIGELENLPNEVLVIHPQALPPWAEEWGGPEI